MRKAPSIFALVFYVICVTGCKKRAGDDGTAINTGKFTYGDSVFYVKNQSYEISPNRTVPGTYTAFPGNLLIDNNTGVITVTVTGKGNESQTGLRYKIMFQPTGSTQIDSTFILLAGINYLDRIYYLSQNDSIISPFYNGSLSQAPPSGTYGIQADNDLGINSANGQINIRECIRRGLFDTPAENGEWEEVNIQYRSDDNSNGALNRLDIALYYYNRLSNVPSNISTVMRAHQSMVLNVAQPAIPVTTGSIDNDLPDNLSINRPRPPCIIIIAN